MGSISTEKPSLLDIFDSLALPALIIDSCNKIVSLNKTAAGLFQYHTNEISGYSIMQTLFEEISPGEAVFESPTVRIKPQAAFNAVCRKRNGEKFTAAVSMTPDMIDGRRLVVIRDTSEQRKLREKNAYLEALNELGGIINSSLSIGTIFRIMFSEIKKMVYYDRVSLLLLNESENSLTVFALDASGQNSPENDGFKKGSKIPLEDTSSGWALKNNRAWINRDLASEISFPLDSKLLKAGYRSTISIPVCRDKVMGVFNLDSAQPSQYSEDDLSLLMPLAKHISIALENALLFEEISREKKEWERTFDAITDMVWIEDGKQRIIRANAALLDTSGFSTSEISGTYCWELLEKIGISPSDDCLCAATIDTCRPSSRELKGADGDIYQFWAYPLFDSDGILYAVVHYLRDVTSQRRLEHQLVRSDKLASLGTLVAGIAHEINNPLGIIAGYAEALLDRSRGRKKLDEAEFEDFPEYLETIHNEIFRCKHILRSLLDFARPSAGTIREIDINELIKEVILLVNHRARRLKHNIDLKLRRDLPKIPAEPGNLRQLFMNIIINSIYFTPENGTVTISSGLDSGMIVVKIADSGSGIKPEHLTKIFDPFFTTKPVGEGTGLGLAICHKIVEEHGGSIDVQSELNKGTTFFIRLPVLSPAASRND